MKKYVDYELVQINFEDSKFKYWRIYVVKQNKQSIQVISHSGKLGNKGQQTILMEVDNNYPNLQKAITKAREQMKLKKEEGFLFKDDVQEKINSLYKKENRCDCCGDYIDKELFKKINEWARTEGGWDKDETCPGYKKVLCIPCQIQNNLYKKRNS